jgi:hypothetical protein
MRISRYLPFALLPAAVFASAAPDAHPAALEDDISLVWVSGVTQEELHLLVERQLDLSGILDLIGPLLDLLRPESLENINLIITQAASLLGDGGAEATKELVAFASDFLNSDAFQELADTLAPLIPVHIHLYL